MVENGWTFVDKEKEAEGDEVYDEVLNELKMEIDIGAQVGEKTIVKKQ